MTPTKHPTRAGTFPKQADYFEKTAEAYQRVANSPGYRANLPARAAVMREVAHYLECAARLPMFPEIYVFCESPDAPSGECEYNAVGLDPTLCKHCGKRTG